MKIPHYACMAWRPLVLRASSSLNAVFDSHRTPSSHRPPTLPSAEMGSQGLHCPFQTDVAKTAPLRALRPLSAGKLGKAQGPGRGHPEPAPSRLNVCGTRKGKWPRVSAEPERSCCSTHPLSESRFTDEEAEARKEVHGHKLEGSGTRVELGLNDGKDHLPRGHL